jgi:hypothetical protein
MELLSIHMLADQGDIWSSELIIQRAKVVKAGSYKTGSVHLQKTKENFSHTEFM